MEFNYDETLFYKRIQIEMEISLNKVYLKNLRFMKRITRKTETNILNKLKYEIDEVKKNILKLEDKLFYL